MLAVMVAAPAFAHFCSNVSKKASAGSIGTQNVATEFFTLVKEFVGKGENGGFITIADGGLFYDTYLHKLLPEGERSAGFGEDSISSR